MAADAAAAGDLLGDPLQLRDVGRVGEARVVRARHLGGRRGPVGALPAHDLTGRVVGEPLARLRIRRDGDLRADLAVGSRGRVASHGRATVLEGRDEHAGHALRGGPHGRNLAAVHDALGLATDARVGALRRRSCRAFGVIGTGYGQQGGQWGKCKIDRTHGFSISGLRRRRELRQTIHK